MLNEKIASEEEEKMLDMNDYEVDPDDIAFIDGYNDQNIGYYLWATRKSDGAKGLLFYKIIKESEDESECCDWENPVDFVIR